MLFRDDEPHLSLVEAGRPWSFDGDGEDFKLAAEAYRIDLAYLFDPMMAVHTSNVEPLPHQITAVYESMLPRQPLRFVLADDPGAGKTIMAGLYIRELMMRADAQRVPDRRPRQPGRAVAGRAGREVRPRASRSSPASWIETRRSGNPFEEHDLLIARLDQLVAQRGPAGQARRSATGTWSSSTRPTSCRRTTSAAKLKKTKRFQLGELLGAHHPPPAADDGHAAQRQGRGLPALPVAARLRPLLRQVPRRRPQGRRLRPDAAHGQGGAAQVRRHAAVPGAPGLHGQLHALRPRGRPLRGGHRLRRRGDEPGRPAQDGKRKGTVGFALTILQRRLASSPEAIYQSLKRRREASGAPPARGEARHRGGRSLAETRARQRRSSRATTGRPRRRADAEQSRSSKRSVVDQATAARTIAELEAEIVILQRPGSAGPGGRRTRGQDRKWDELSQPPAGRPGDARCRRAAGAS